MNNEFRMNWCDFKNNRFKYKGTIHSLYLRKNIISQKVRLKTRIMFLLNVYRGRWLALEEIVEFAYGETHWDEWPEHQENIITQMINRMRKTLPEGVHVVSSRSFGYQLNIKEENN